MPSIEAFLARLLPATIRIDLCSANKNLPKVKVDPVKFEAVMINLAINARDAMPDGGALRILAEARALGAQESRELSLDTGQYVVVVVEDEGEGIAPDVLSQVTEPFFTTKAVGEGSGLGLSMARGFAEQSGGALDIRSTPGVGTKVWIYLPVAEAAA